AIEQYNQTAAHKVSMQGGPAFQDSKNPVTDYSYVPSTGPSHPPFVRNRQYKIQQNFFVSIGIAPDMTITLFFDLSLMLGGSTDGGKDIHGKTTGPTNQSIVAEVLNPTASVSNNDNPLFSSSDVQQAHDQIIAFAEQTPLVAIPLPGGPFLSLKVLTTSAGVRISDANFPGVGTVAVLLKPSV
ncbi:MAG TPA: hypothetical protein VEI53_13150, partial [Ktedonobacteraceae bacterium]|nr:hypothetical protein [Ktedonobacteraceae bacterium]